ncbi:hypothetical protein GGS23DRAFT_126519 [Durotheca rogersii]|uniref:uncharacterized protein n=1 Tax=Durotheca rogersii TaxID=419775 RepID=UPI00221F7386|nr:uncharacterized protein GGS23DRAFT_126519 [Durotheca rogersii]KAI5861693.1 hypothetical protein GGS23DRAFT_126519 [Durotheca rogersii]
MTYAPPNMQAGDDLAALFSRNLTLQPQPAPAAQETPKAQEPEQTPIVYSITQHYHHSAHLARQEEPLAQPQRPSSEPPQTQQPSAEAILSSHGINYAALSAAQLELFKSAEDSQKIRLIELWHFCPPTNTQDSLVVSWIPTTVEQEELLAKLRYDRRLAEEQNQNMMSMDGTPLTPVQTGDGRWVAMSDVEPYMMSGYEALAQREYEESAKQQYVPISKDVYNHFGISVAGPTYRPATDPVYDNDWTRQQQAMENQYGAFQQMDGMEL